MAIIDRDATSFAIAPDPRGSTAASSPLVAPTTPITPITWSGPGRVLFATLAITAGAIHLVMVPSHAAEWMAEGIAFALAGWFQIGLAVLVMARPSSLALRIGCVVNLAFIGVWAVSRIWGLPVGPEAGIAHAASFVDITCVLLEAALVVVGAALLLRPDLGSRLGSDALVMLSVIPVALVLLTTAAITSPSALNHGHAAGDAAGHVHGSGDEAAAADDKGLSQIMNGQGEGGGHTHNDTVVPVDPATQELLDAQLARTQPFIEGYPTVAAAEAAGYHRQGPFVPGLGTHYQKGTPVGLGLNQITDAALDNPTLIYDGIAPDSKLAGFMYLIFPKDLSQPPEGFVGPNDHWHFHTNVCLVTRPDGGFDAPLGADTTATPALCETYKGFLVANTGYMVHVWTVPGYESPQGLFSNLNAKITCPNGTYYVIAPEELGTRSNMCRDVTN